MALVRPRGRAALSRGGGDGGMGKSHGHPPTTFGPGRRGTSIGWAAFESGLAVGYITNGFRGAATNNARLAAVSQAVRDACI